VAAIRTRGLIRIYASAVGSVAALRGVDLDVAPGEIAAVVGASGSGKSTLVRVLAGSDAPSAGATEVLGLSLERATSRDLTAHRRDRVGVVEQHYWRSLSPYLSARAAIELPLRLRGWPADRRSARSSELLGRIGLPDRGGALPSQLSGGEQQRVAFAVAVAPRPQLLLADEPTAELDEHTAGEILALLRDLVRAEGMTALVVTHDRLVEDLADRIVYLQDGRAVATRAGGPSSVPIALTDEAGWTAPALPPPPPHLEPLAAAAGAAPAVVVAGLTRTYGTGPHAIDAVRDLDAAFTEGGLHVVTGPSGSGKSTLLRLIAGLDRPTSGRVTTLGTDLGGLDRAALARFRGAALGFCPQAPRLIPFLSVVENLEIALLLRSGPAAAGDPATNAAERSSSADRRQLANAALAQIGLTERADAAPETLSGGERARVAIARAIVGGPRLLLLDEPTAALDRASAASLVRLLGTLDRARVTIVVATHDRELIAAAADRLDLRDVRHRTRVPGAAATRA